MPPEVPSSTPPNTNPVPPQTPPESPLKQIRTYQGDVAEALKTQQESVFSIREKEHARDALMNAGKSPEEKAKSKSALVSVILFIVSIILLGAGGYAAWTSYETYLAKTAVPAEVTIPNQLVTVSSTADLNIASTTRDGLIEAAANDRAKQLAPGSADQILLRGGTGAAPAATTAQFLNALASQAPAALVRSFDPVFMLGTLGGAQSSTFVLVKLDSFDGAFAGMLDWEAGSLPQDLVPLFADASTSTAVLTSTTTPPAFTDVTIKNKDARVLKDPYGKDVLVYSFFDQNTLVFTDSEDDLRALITLLTSEQLSQ